MRRVLFVDDEPKVLQGLERMLRPMRKEWEMAFAAGGPEALEALEQKHFDVLITDMRMPGMDGCRLLERVRDLHPRVVRIILSGHSDKEMILKSAGAAHQYLSKPCDAEALKRTIGRACALRGLLEDQALLDVISRVETLPSLPSLFSEVMEEIASPEGSLARVGEIISKDVGMSAKILQLVNSSFFGQPTRVTSAVRAVSLLGLETVKALVLSAKIFSQCTRPGPPGYNIAALWNHSLRTGVFAKNIARAENGGRSQIDEAFMAGLLHDVGKLILLDRLPEACGEIALAASRSGCRLWEAEREVLGTTHAQVGAYLLGIWGISEPIVEAIAFHHCPDTSPNESSKSFGALTAVHAANALELEGLAQKNAGPGEPCSSGYLEAVGCGGRMETWRAVCDDSIRRGEFSAS